MDNIPTPVYDEKITITYKKNSNNLGEGVNVESKKKYIDEFFSKKYIDSYFSKK